MNEPHEDFRPESLPAQVSRFARRTGRIAYRTRASWTPFVAGVVLPLLPLVVVQLFWPDARLWNGYAIALGLAGGVASVPPVVVGLWTALSDRTLASRWGAGLLAIVGFSVLRLFLGSSTYNWLLNSIIVFAATTLSWVLWVGVGLATRLLSGRVLSDERSTHSVPGPRIADFFLLSTGVMIAFALNEAVTKQLAAFMDSIESVSGGVRSSLFVGWLIKSVVPLLPLLWSVAKPTTRRIVVAATLSWVLMVGADIAYNAGIAAMSGVPVVPDYASTITRNLGAVIGVCCVGLAISWAGYRFKRPSPSA